MITPISFPKTWRSLHDADLYELLLLVTELALAVAQEANEVRRETREFDFKKKRKLKGESGYVWPVDDDGTGSVYQSHERVVSRVRAASPELMRAVMKNRGDCGWLWAHRH
ncbi:hypothetical protein Droror1_Dr00015473 [Drosera rotundifolia]